MDALEVLRTQAGFQEPDVATFWICHLELSEGDTLPLVQLRFIKDNVVHCVSLPAAKQFKARRENPLIYLDFAIDRLFGARIDGRGHIRLIDGTELRDMVVRPGFLNTEPTPLDWRIVHLTLELIGARHCYRSLRDDLPPQHRHMVPDFYLLDVRRLSGLSLPPLKDIVAFVCRRYRKVSGQQVANSLRKFGMRLPRPRPV